MESKCSCGDKKSVRITELKDGKVEELYLCQKCATQHMKKSAPPKQLEYKTGGPSLIEHLYTEEMIRELSQDFDILDLQCYEKELSEGARHTGMSALLGMVAKKSS